MLIDRYLSGVFGLVAFDAILLTFTYSALRDSSLAPLILGARIAVDVIFLTFALRHIKLTKMELMLICMVLLSCLLATLPGLQYSSAYSVRRFLNDISGPLLFILKVSALRSLFRQNFTALRIKKLTRALMYLSVIQVLIFLYFSAQTGAYAGITPPVNIPAAFYIGTFNNLGLAAAVILIVLSGKRSFLVSVAVVSAFAIIMRGSYRKKLAFFTLLAALTTLLAAFGNEKISFTVNSAVEFLAIFEMRHINFDSEQVRSVLYLLTGGRSEEFYGILGEMTPWSWFIGLGPGFTYSILHVDGHVDGYANAHFSPLSLTYKFGVIYAIVFYFYLIGTIRSLLFIAHSQGFIVGCVLSIFLLQSIFAFNIFSEPYFPILLALGMAIVSVSSFERRSVVARRGLKLSISRDSIKPQAVLSGKN